MYARNPRNGTPIVATLERVYGHTKLVRDGFRKHDDGIVDRKIQSPTETLWHTSETIGYLDANNEEVDWDDIELYEPASTPAGSGGGGAAAADRDASKEHMRDPAARAGNTAARAVERIIAEVNAHQHEEAAAGAGTDDDESAMNDALEAFSTNASTGVAGIQITSRLSSPTTAGDAPTLTKHADEAVIHLKRKHPVQIHCFRHGNRFRVNQVTAIEEGHLSRVGPTTESTTQLELYANTILQAWGL